MQSILDSWLKGESKRKLYNVLYLDWGEGPQPKFNAIWLDNIPKDINIKKKIHFRKIGIDVMVCGNIENTKELKQADIEHTPLLKSNLQKCIRRGLVNKSLGTAKVMIKTDFMDFIRRLSIIMLEDTTLNQYFNILMWMIAAFPEWKPSKYHINWLLCLVKYLAELKVRDNYYGEEFDFNSEITKINDLSEMDRSIIYCLEFRKSYGGMKGDMLMIQFLTKMWIKRFDQRNHIDFVYQDIPFENIKVSNIKINEIELSSVDFHCFPAILNLVFNRHPNYQIEELKKAIWFFSSRINVRTIINPELIVVDESEQYSKIWDRIKNDVNYLSKSYLNKFIN